jgi:hypothetical protein
MPPLSKRSLFMPPAARKPCLCHPLRRKTAAPIAAAATNHPRSRHRLSIAATSTRSRYLHIPHPRKRRPRGRLKTRRMRKGERQRKRKEANVAARAAALGAPVEFPDRAPQRCDQCGGISHKARTCKGFIQVSVVGARV